MTQRKHLTADDVRELLSEHIEGTLHAELRVEVDDWLARDPRLAQERVQLVETMTLLGELEAPGPPQDLVGAVRRRLTAERKAALGAVNDDVSLPAPGPSWATRRSTSGWRRWGGIEVALGLAAAASVAAFFALSGDGGRGGGAAGTTAAGLGGDVAVVTTTLLAPGFPRFVVVDLARRAGMDSVVGDTYEGDRRAAARFLLLLKETAVVRGVEISGVIPDAERVRVEVEPE